MHGNNFFNPYMYQPSYQTSNLMTGFGNMNNVRNIARASGGLGIASSGGGLSGIKGLLGKFSFSGFLNGASKTLNVVNQAIPIFYQVKPIINNAKTMFRIMGAVKDDNNSTNNRTISTTRSANTTDIISESNSPTNQKNTANYQSYSEENPTFFI